MSFDPLLKDGARFNELTQRIDVVKHMGWDRGKTTGPAMTDDDLYNMHLYCDKTYGITSLKLVEEAVHIVAHRNAYHPIRDILNSLQWDGTPRIRYALQCYLGADDSDYTYQILKFFLLGAISRVFQPGIKFDYIMCLVGDQGAGKSSFLRLLSMKDEWFCDDLKKVDDDNVYRKLQGHWFIEFGELNAKTKAQSIEEFKAFLTRPALKGFLAFLVL